MEGDNYHSLQREQNERIKSLETKIEDLVNFNERIRKLEEILNEKVK